jgi:hypothetical protein
MFPLLMWSQGWIPFLFSNDGDVHLLCSFLFSTEADSPPLYPSSSATDSPMDLEVAPHQSAASRPLPPPLRQSACSHDFDRESMLCKFVRFSMVSTVLSTGNFDQFIGDIDQFTDQDQFSSDLKLKFEFRLFLTILTDFCDFQ